MAGAVAVVTDSTACLPDDLVAEYGVAAVPLRVAIGGAPQEEGHARTAADAARGVRDWRPVTSRPPPARFALAYRDAAASGATGIVSVRLSGAMSGTVESARLAANDAPVPVRVVDSRAIGMGLGFARSPRPGPRRAGPGSTRWPPPHCAGPGRPARCSTSTRSSTCAGAAASAGRRACSVPH